MQEKIPITIGIIGHLDAIVTNEHYDKIAELFNDLQKNYPNSPVCLFSQLAKGADTIVADFFLKIKEKTNRDYHLIVPLPFDIEKYKSKFMEDEIGQFENLLSKADRHYVLEYEKKHSENILYRLGGKFIADSSVILIALWNGEYNEKPGGTGDIVKYKIEGKFDKKVGESTFDEDAVESIFDLKGSVISLPCNRDTDAVKNIIELPTDPLLDIIRKDNKDTDENSENKMSNENSISKTLTKIEQINKASKKTDKKIAIKSGNDLYPDKEYLDETKGILKRYYALTDSQAITNQQRYHWIVKGLFLFGIIIIAFFELYKHVGLKQIFLAITMFLITLAYAFFLVSRKWKNHQKFLENRVLAEALRIQFFWNLGNVKKRVSRYILRIHKTEFNWIKHILLAIYGITYNRATSEVSAETITKYWLTSQHDFFDKKLIDIRKTEKRYNTISIISFFIALLLMVSLFFLPHFTSGKELQDVLIVIIGILFGIFALLKAYIEKKGYDQILNQYSLMRDIYQSATQRIGEIEKTRGNNNEKIKEVDALHYLAGREALIENGNWYLIFKGKAPEFEGIG